VIRLVAVFSLVAAFTSKQDHHCGHNRTCIERVAARSCSTLHDHHHCVIWRRWRWRLEQGYAAFRAEETAAAASSPSAVAVNSDPPPASSPDLADVAGVPASFAACVAMRESTDGAGSSNIYGILPMNGYYDGMSLAAQKELFSQMYEAQGSGPWAPYDGC
jgi:hypothetical protein